MVRAATWPKLQAKSLRFRGVTLPDLTREEWLEEHLKLLQYDVMNAIDKQEHPGKPVGHPYPLDAAPLGVLKHLLSRIDYALTKFGK